MSTENLQAGLGFDPADCDNMTIHEPGLIQPHGALLVLCPEDLKVVQVSANTKRWLGSEPEAVLSRSIDEVLGAAEAARLRTVVATERLDMGPRFALTLPPRQNALPLDVALHMRHGLLLLELEAAGRSEPGADDPYTLLRDAVARLQSSADVRGFCQTGPVGEFLSPRRSFERWAETVRGNGTPWLAVEVEAAARLREAVLERLHSRALAKDRLQAELEANRKDIDSFVYVASHDLKEPLRGIHKYAHMLIERTGAKLDPEERQRLDGLVRLTDRIGSLIESLLHLSRVGRLDLSISDVDLGALVAEAVEIAAPRVTEAGAEVVIGSLPTVRCDRGWVREVLVNLITNALKYNDKAQKRVEIGVATLRAAGDLPAIPVRDNGIGIAERHKDAVFAMFKRLHGPSEYGGGTGAGLAIARKIIERHGGRVWLESTPGEGSTFFFTLAAGERPA